MSYNKDIWSKCIAHCYEMFAFWTKRYELGFLQPLWLSQSHCCAGWKCVYILFLYTHNLSMCVYLYILISIRSTRSMLVTIQKSWLHTVCLLRIVCHFGKYYLLAISIKLAHLSSCHQTKWISNPTFVFLMFKSSFNGINLIICTWHLHTYIHTKLGKNSIYNFLFLKI